MKLREAHTSKKVVDKTSGPSHDLGIELNEVKKKIDRLNDIQSSLWNSLITFNGILIATFSITASLAPKIFNPSHFRNLLIITTGSILLFVLNFYLAHVDLKKNIEKELRIIDLKIKGLNINALNGPPKINNKHKVSDQAYKRADRWIKFIAKKSIEFALMLTLISVIYFWVLIFKFIK